tara:strand:+ start:178 stop:378 length:201 start_codon:yes stop_codon:yes gene_type:complete
MKWFRGPTNMTKQGNIIWHWYNIRMNIRCSPEICEGLATQYPEPYMRYSLLSDKPKEEEEGEEIHE